MSSSHFQELATRLKDRSLPIWIFETFLWVVLNVMNVFGNFLVCWIVYKTPRLRTVPNSLLVSLSVSDLLLGLIIIPLSVGVMISGEWLYSDAVCLTEGFLSFYSGMASVYMLALISLNRFFATCKPTKYRQIFNKRNTYIFIIIVWILPLIATIPPLAVPKLQYSYNPGKTFCLYPFESNLGMSLFLLLGFIGVPLNIIMGCTQKIVKALRANNRRVAAMTEGSSENNRKISGKEMRVTKTLIAAVVAFCTCWLPIGIIDFIDTFRGAALLPREVYVLDGFLIFLSSAINPICYGITNAHFRREYKNIFRNLLGRRQNGVVTDESTIDTETHVTNFPGSSTQN